MERKEVLLKVTELRDNEDWLPEKIKGGNEE
jgi:hypothetical protein